MKKLISVLSFMLVSIIGYSQTPEIGHFQQLATIKRGDTLDVKWYYKPAAGVDIRTLQIDWQYKKTLFTHISSSVDATVSGNAPQLDFQEWDNYKYGSYSNGVYSYNSDTNWSVARNYLILANGSAVSSNGYVIHNKFKINDVESNYVEDSITVNWARMFKVDGTTIGDNVASLSYKKMDLKLLGNLTISGKIWFPSTITAATLPTLYCYENATGLLVSQTVPNINGNYTLKNIDDNKTYKIEVRFPNGMLGTIRDNAVTVSDAVKAFNEYTVTNVNQGTSHNYLKTGLSYLMGDINLNSQLDGGDPYGIYASVSGLKPIDTTKLINVFKKSEYDSLVLGSNQWVDWTTFSNKGVYIIDSVGTTNLTLDIKYFVLGDVDRSHSSPVYDATGTEVFATIYHGQYDVNIADVYSVGQPMYVPFNIATNGDLNNGLQFEMEYDVSKVKFDEIISDIQGPWLQYVTHDNVKGIVRFGAMNNQKNGSLQGVATPFKLKFSAIDPTHDITTDVVVRSLMDACDKEGDHLNINLSSGLIVMMYKAIQLPVEPVESTVNIYPNPNNGNFELVLDLIPNTKLNASIYDYNGRLILDLGDFATDDNRVKFSKNVNQQQLPEGMYLMILSGYNKRITKPFIKF
jgi:hypothetical protein